MNGPGKGEILVQKAKVETQRKRRKQRFFGGYCRELSTNFSWGQANCA